MAADPDEEWGMEDWTRAVESHGFLGKALQLFKPRKKPWDFEIFRFFLCLHPQDYTCSRSR